MKLEYGDRFEIAHCDWLRSRLPYYEKIWAAFIGNDGHSRSLPMPGLSPDQEASRCDFYQAHYTVAQRCFSIDERMKQQAAETLGKVVDHNELHREFELLRAFMEAIGHVRDMFGKMDHALSLGGSVVDGLQHFYSQRSHVMHGTWMPYAIDSGFLKIPLVAKE